MKTTSTKTGSVLPRLVKKGFALHQQLSVLNEQFKKIKERLKAEAAARPTEHLPLLEKDSNGTQWIALAPGCECRIVFPDPKVTNDFDPGASEFLAIRSLAGEHFNSLFKKAILFRPVDKKTFRNQVKALLSAKAAAQLIELTTSATEPKATWKARPLGKERK
jgi:hypothetical protein